MANKRTTTPTKPAPKAVKSGTVTKNMTAPSRAASTGDSVGGYLPSETEPYMNSTMLAYFESVLQEQRRELLRETQETIQLLQEESLQQPDLTDRASLETDTALELRARDRQRKLIVKIDEALARIKDKTYGYCEETGEPIGVKRLLARPVATLSIEAQERHEKFERSHRDDDSD